MSIAGIVFDKDGTLFDFSATWEAWAAAFLSRLARSPSEARRMADAIGFDMAHQRFARDSIAIAGTPEEVARALCIAVPDLSAPDLVTVLNEEAVRAPQRETVPLAAYLDGLRAEGLKLGVATNDAEAPARAHLETAGVLDRFDFIAGSDSGFGGKPAPGQLRAFSDQMGLAPERIVMVGDSTHDLRAGRAAGMRCIGVLTGLADAGTLAPLADVVLPDIGGLPGWLRSL